MKTDDILRRTPTGMRPVLQVVLERIDELETIIAQQAEEIAALKKKATASKTKKTEEPEA
jgi:hypothetical protein